MPLNSLSKLTIAATFTAEPLEPYLSFLLDQAGLDLSINFAPYHQIFQELMSDASSFALCARGVNVILVRLEDFFRDIAPARRTSEAIGTMVDDLHAALKAYASRARISTVLSVLDPCLDPEDPLLPSYRSETSRLATLAKSIPGLVLLSAEEVTRVSGSDRIDHIADTLAHVPFTQGHFASISLALIRKVHAILVPPKKVLVLDCDNTIWRGIVGEDGINGITVTQGFASLQQFAIRLHSEGILLCLASKNAEADVLEVFGTHPDMLLNLDHLVAHKINWRSKADNIIDLAKILNLGLDTFVFMDDNPIECAQVRIQLPQVITLQIPPEDRLSSYLDHLWVFDKVTVTDEDARRTALYKEEASRQKFENLFSNISDFVASLQLQIDFALPSDGDWSRLSQLTQRTNQFNFTTIRRTEAELRAEQKNGADILRVSVRDRFGDYGIVGLLVLVSRGKTLVVDSFLLSCRVLGRGVEHAIVREIARIASDKALLAVSFPFFPTAKNEPALAFIESIAAQYKTVEGSASSFNVSTQEALRVAHRPGHDPEAVIKAAKSNGLGGSTKPNTKNITDKSEQYAALAVELVDGRAVEAATKKRAAKPRPLSSVASEPETDVEKALLQIWGDILAISGLGVDDEFFALGGTSLLAARLIAEVSRTFGTRLPLTMILTAPTVRLLADHITESNKGSLQGLIELKPGIGKTLYLVHDGDGETLLYANLARRLPDSIRVVGLNPPTNSGAGLPFTDIESMARYYRELIQGDRQDEPYLLGGMCAGGVIAFELARQLAERGQPVANVLLLDAAAPNAEKRTGRIGKQRLGRLAGLLEDAHSDSSFRALARVGIALLRKAYGLLSWEIVSRTKAASVAARFRLQKALLRAKREWPAFIPPLTFRQVYESAERRFATHPLESSAVTLFRARSGEGGDTPFVEIYLDPALGWERLAGNMTVVDVAGGHYSMLQEPFVDQLSSRVSEAIVPREGQPEPRTTAKKEHAFH